MGQLVLLRHGSDAGLDGAEPQRRAQRAFEEHHLLQRPRALHQAGDAQGQRDAPGRGRHAARRRAVPKGRDGRIMPTAGLCLLRDYAARDKITSKVPQIP